MARRLLTAATACVVVWRLAREPSAEAETLRSLLIRLSGRQMEYGRRQTLPALLAGLGVLLAMLEALEQHNVEQLQQFKNALSDASEEDSG